MGSELRKFGQRLKKARVEKGYTQEDLAKKLNTSKSVISGYESGTNDPRQSIVKEMSKILGVSIDWLMGIEKEHYYNNEKTRLIANKIGKDKNLAMLFDAAEDVSAEDLKAVHQLLKSLKRKKTETCYYKPYYIMLLSIPIN